MDFTRNIQTSRRTRFEVSSRHFIPWSTNDLRTRETALVTPILKKKCLDHNDLNNYRPVSNLCFIAKILEKLVLSQVSSYLNSHNLYNTCQSAYRPGHSTETALLKIVNDLFLSLDKGNISVLALLDFSSAFNNNNNGYF